MSRDASTSDDLSAYVDTLLQLGGQMALILNHMSSMPAPADAEPFDVVLHRLISGVLDDPVGSRPALELPAATSTLRATIENIGDELFLVAPGAFDEIAAREDRRARRKLPMRPRRPC